MVASDSRALDAWVMAMRITTAGRAVRAGQPMKAAMTADRPGGRTSQVRASDNSGSSSSRIRALSARIADLGIALKMGNGDQQSWMLGDGSVIESLPWWRHAQPVALPHRTEDSRSRIWWDGARWQRYQPASIADGTDW